MKEALSKEVTEPATVSINSLVPYKSETMNSKEYLIIVGEYYTKDSSAEVRKVVRIVGASSLQTERFVSYIIVAAARCPTRKSRLNLIRTISMTSFLKWAQWSVEVTYELDSRII